LQWGDGRTDHQSLVSNAVEKTERGLDVRKKEQKNQASNEDGEFLGQTAT